MVRHESPFYMVFLGVMYSVFMSKSHGLPPEAVKDLMDLSLQFMGETIPDVPVATNWYLREDNQSNFYIPCSIMFYLQYKCEVNMRVIFQNAIRVTGIRADLAETIFMNSRINDFVMGQRCASIPGKFGASIRTIKQYLNLHPTKFNSFEVWIREEMHEIYGNIAYFIVSLAEGNRFVVTSWNHGYIQLKEYPDVIRCSSDLISFFERLECGVRTSSSFYCV